MEDNYLDLFIQWNKVNLNNGENIPELEKDIFGKFIILDTDIERYGMLRVLDNNMLRDSLGYKHKLIDGFKWAYAESIETSGEYNVNDKVRIKVEAEENVCGICNGDNHLAEIIKIDNLLYYSIGFDTYYRLVPEDILNSIVVK